MENPFEEQPCVLVVDDEEEIAKMFAVVLQMNLFNAIPYSDPRVAFEAAKRKAPDYLLDGCRDAWNEWSGACD
jgi:FixJ family two-component response regulator